MEKKICHLYNFPNSCMPSDTPAWTGVVHLVQAVALRILYLGQLGIRVIVNGLKLSGFTGLGFWASPGKSHVLPRLGLLFMGGELCADRGPVCPRGLGCSSYYSSPGTWRRQPPSSKSKQPNKTSQPSRRSHLCER